MADPVDDAVNDPGVLAEIAALLARYEAALMANDVAVLDALFWRSEHVRRFGAGECLYGHAAIAAYRAARPGGAPPRRVVRQSITSFGSDFATADIEFEPLGHARRGRQTQAWVRRPEGWRIVSAHVSFLQA